MSDVREVPVARVEHQTPVSFDELYRAEYPRLVGLATVLVDDRPTAEEVVQDAFLQLHRRWGAIENPHGFLRRCVVNGGRDVQRRRTVRRLHPVERSEVVEHQFAELDHSLARLPYKQRAAIVLRYALDLPEAEIAAALDVRPATVRMLIKRGLDQLRNEVEK